MSKRNDFWNWCGRLGAKLANTWILELAAISFSIVCLLTLVGVLSSAAGKEIQSWSGVTLNTLVSLLATACKLSALFALASAIGQSKWNSFSRGPHSLLQFETIDLASRSVVGCLQMVFQTRIAFLGAVAIIIAVGFDPFAQQLVQYTTIVDYQPGGNASVPFAHRYSRGTRTPVQATEPPQTIAMADFALQAAVMNGIALSPDIITQQLAVTCSSGNCTWPTIESLAVCGKCNNITDYLETAKSDREAALWVYLSQGSPSTMYCQSATTYGLPNGLFIQNCDQEAAYLLMTMSSTADPAKTVSMKDLDTLLYSTTLLRTSPTVNSSSMDWSATPVEATECSLRFCVKEYDMNITNNRILEHSRENTTATRSPRSWMQDNISGARPNTPKGNATDDLGFDSATASIDRTDLMLGDQFNISQEAVYSMGSFLRDLFTVNTTEDPIMGYYLTRQRYQPAIAGALYNSSDLQPTFESLAASMSNAIRVGGDDALQHPGEDGRLITKYRIEWYWLALPATVVLASLLQLVYTMLESMRKEAPLWKNSTLATLSRGRYVAEIFEDTEKLLDMRDAADGHDVYLFQDESRVRHAAESPSGAHQDRSSVGTLVGSAESYPMLPVSPSFAPLKMFDNDDPGGEPNAADGVDRALLRASRVPSQR